MDARRGAELPPPNLRGVIVPSGFWFFAGIGSAFLLGRFETLPAPLPLLVPGFDPLPVRVAIFEGLCTSIWPFDRPGFATLIAGDRVSRVNCISGTVLGCACSFSAEGA